MYVDSGSHNCKSWAPDGGLDTAMEEAADWGGIYCSAEGGTGTSFFTCASGGAGVGPSLLPHAQCLTEPLGCGSVRFLRV